MVDSGPTGVEARVTRYTVRRFRVGQALIPLAMLVTVLARRSENPVAMVVMVGVLGFTLFALLSAIKRFGEQSIRIDRGSIWFCPSNERVRRERVRDWTWLNGVARLYGSDSSYTLKACSGSEVTLEASLQGLLGAPQSLQRRGTFRARMIALGIAFLGLAACGAAFMLDSIPLIVAGVPAFGIGLATFGALSQRVVQGNRQSKFGSPASSK